MIRFSRMTDYGVLLLGHFARSDVGQVSSTELAETYHMPRPVIANLLKAFGRAGLLLSRRGLHGGYRLARPASEISLLSVLEAVEGPVALIECAADDLLSSHCDYVDVCPSRHPMQRVHRRIVDLLAGITLAELVEAPPAARALRKPARKTVSRTAAGARRAHPQPPAASLPTR